MKKLFCIAVFMLNFSLLFAQLNISNFEYSYMEDSLFFVGFNNHVYEVDIVGRQYIDLTENIKIDNNGFYWLSFPCDGQDPILVKNQNYLLIAGSNQVFCLQDSSRIQHLYQANEDSLILNINSTSYLTKKTSKGIIEYKPQNLLYKFFATDKEFRYELIPSSLPWAIKNNEIDTAILSIKTKHQTNGFVILNGYVDLQNRQLYNKNSRVKEIEIVNNLTGRKYIAILQDKIQYQEIRLPFYSDSFSLKVLSTYPGASFSDICISAILPFFSEQTNKENHLFRTNEKTISNGYFLTQYKLVKTF